MDSFRSVSSQLVLAFTSATNGGLAAELHRAVFTLKYFFLPSILFAVALASCPKTPRYRWVCYLSFACYVSLCSNPTALAAYRTGHVWFDHSIGTTVGSCLLNALHVLVLVDPFKEYRHQSDDLRGGKPRELPWLKRVYWAWSVLMSLRGVGWNYQMPHIPERSEPPPTRTKFILNMLGNLIRCYLLVDLTQNLLRAAPFLHHHQRPQDFSLRSLPFHQRFFCIATWFTSGYAAISAQYYTVALVCVTCRFSEPGDWPPPFGSLASSYSVRNFWGKTWHSFIRRFCISPGNKLIQLLQIPSKSIPAGLIKLYTTFLISALLHSVGDYTISPEYYGLSFLFFILQPVAITCEELIKCLLHKYVEQERLERFYFAGKVIGYIWVGWWLTETAPFLLDPAMLVGFDRHRIFPHSPMSRLAAKFELFRSTGVN
ncbi:hypothetical protein GYMLUDRAFT_75913 [Collybiopsis luxurians FD-317 M1]|uniref:Wax synthase domain-containing protein n=1 Tax=Collybiopsis luxurians FD-317 M1 TaxID=944289 RepID=A0A0D0CNJ9_9AGAR|nr:hypothetical protein GYMLUDRAFT_75913 [Collybiopsis luxurians FD-317 M1]